MILDLQHVSKSFRQGDQNIPILKDFNLQLEPGQTLAVVGPSGSGKSTLLSLLAGLDQPDSGKIFVASHEMTGLDEKALTLFRSQNLGIVFQQYYLFSHLTALENVMLPLEIQNQPKAKERATEALHLVGLDHRLQHYPHQLSGGENQRVAIARAFVIKPRLLLADEPSGSLDNRTGEQVMDLLFELVKKEKTTLILVTHNESLARRCEKQLKLGPEGNA